MKNIKYKLNIQYKNIRYDTILSIIFPKYSRNYIQKLIKLNCIKINNKIIKSCKKSKGNEIININIKKNFIKKNFLISDKINFNFIYENFFFIIINKPIGLVMHPAPGNLYKTLLNGILFNNKNIKNIPRFGIIHRLDKNTSGLIIISKTLNIYKNLINQFKFNIIKRYYIALVWGITKLKDVINISIIKHPKNILKKIISLNKNNKIAITFYKRLYIGKLNNNFISLIICKLKTGKTHQIRVHLSYIKHPIIGDNLYGNKFLNKKLKFQALQSFKLNLINPLNKNNIFFCINTSNYLNYLIKKSNIKKYNFCSKGIEPITYGLEGHCSIH